MASFANWIANYFVGYIVKLYNIVIDAAQLIFDGLITLIIGIVSLFPSGPSVPTGPSALTDSMGGTILNAINWVFPFSYLVTLIGFMAAGYLAYVVIAPLARWVKLST